MRRKRADALALGAPASQGGHIGLNPGLIDKNQPLGIQIWLAGTPPLAAGPNIGTDLFKSEQTLLWNGPPLTSRRKLALGFEGED